MMNADVRRFNKVWFFRFSNLRVSASIIVKESLSFFGVLGPGLETSTYILE
jgi:hypothetical protein